MVAQLVSDIAEIETEEGELIPVEMDPLLLIVRYTGQGWDS